MSCELNARRWSDILDFKHFTGAPVHQHGADLAFGYAKRYYRFLCAQIIKPGLVHLRRISHLV